MNNYQENSQKLQAAFMAFKGYYQTMYPLPEKPGIKKGKGWVYGGIALMVISATILSGTHSIPIFMQSTSLQDGWRYLVAISAFVGITVGMFIASFLHTKHRFQFDKKNSHPKQIGGMLIIIQVLTFTIEIIANLYSSTEGLGLQPSHEFLVLLAVVIGLSAPVQALVSGHVLGVLVVIDLSTHEKALADYQDALDKYNIAFMEAWAKAQRGRAFGVTVHEPDRPQISNPVHAALSAGQPDTDGHGHGNGQGYNKRTDARRVVWEFLLGEVDPAQLTVREIAEKLGVGKSTVADVRREFLDKNG